MGYFLDLKKPVPAFIEGGHSKVEGSKIFHVSKRALFLWIQQKRAGRTKIEIARSKAL